MTDLAREMSTAEILAELPKLPAEERTQVFERLSELQERDPRQGSPHWPSRWNPASASC